MAIRLVEYKTTTLEGKIVVEYNVPMGLALRRKGAQGQISLTIAETVALRKFLDEIGGRHE